MASADLVHVIDDDAAVRDSLAAVLCADGLAVKTYASASEFLDHVETAAAGCVVTDVHMPELSGLELLRRLNGRTRRFPVVVLTGQADVAMAVEALKNGARDFIEKPFESDSIIRAVRAALEDVTTSADLSTRHAESRARIESLSAREREVLDGLVAGRSNKMIAQALGISPRTVESYRANLMIKLQAQSLSELVRMAITSGAAA
jgi:two-component system response regulator FixJ